MRRRSGLRSFPRAKSFNTRLSRLRFATKRFSFEFSCSNSFNRFAWSTCSPPYSLRQRKYVCSTIPASFDACAVVFPFATATSICHNRLTTYSGWYFLPRPICSPCPVSLFSTGTFLAGHSTATSRALSHCCGDELSSSVEPRLGGRARNSHVLCSLIDG
jgi:hypothetical protein